MNATVTENMAVATGLSKSDVQALRQADSVSFHHNGETGTYASARKRVKDTGPFGEEERSYRLTIGSEFSGKCNRNARCSELVYGYADEWRTLAELLRPGDELSAHWCADGHRNNYLENARVMDGCHGQGEELHADSLSLVVRRGKRKMTFLLRVQICPYNTARMIQPPPF